MAGVVRSYESPCLGRFSAQRGFEHRRQVFSSTFANSCRLVLLDEQRTVVLAPVLAKKLFSYLDLWMVFGETVTVCGRSFKDTSGAKSHAEWQETLLWGEDLGDHFDPRLGLGTRCATSSYAGTSTNMPCVCPISIRALCVRAHC